MVDYELLGEKIKSSGKKFYVIAEDCGLTTQGLYNKLEGKNEFKHSEIVNLCETLGLTSKDRERIFFNWFVDF